MNLTQEKLWGAQFKLNQSIKETLDEVNLKLNDLHERLKKLENMPNATLQ